ncbi:hypothetical protein NJ7G_0323 [Natrinema sp. J7-2]|nr:hypothetical protein NJ7G_0323 [Natrinema sp. J7-2]
MESDFHADCQSIVTHIYCSPPGEIPYTARVSKDRPLAVATRLAIRSR